MSSSRVHVSAPAPQQTTASSSRNSSSPSPNMSLMTTTGQGRWYFSAERLHMTPSRRHNISSERELGYRQQAANFIQDMGQRLHVPQLCINTAIVYMQRFYMFHSFTHFHRNTIAVAALFLAAKVEEQPRKLEHVIKVAHICLHRDQPPLDIRSEQYLEQAQELVTNENILLQTLGFDVAIDHPHTHVVRCCQLVKASKDLAQTSYFMATNSLHLTTMCLRHTPTIVACVCIHLACKWTNYKIPLSSRGKEWFLYVDPNTSLELLNKLTDEFLTIFDRCPSRLKKKIMATAQATKEEEERRASNDIPASHYTPDYSRRQETPSSSSKHHHPSIPMGGGGASGKSSSHGPGGRSSGGQHHGANRNDKPHRSSAPDKMGMMAHKPSQGAPYAEAKKPPPPPNQQQPSSRSGAVHRHLPPNPRSSSSRPPSSQQQQPPLQKHHNKHNAPPPPSSQQRQPSSGQWPVSKSSSSKPHSHQQSADPLRHHPATQQQMNKTLPPPSNTTSSHRPPQQQLPQGAAYPQKTSSSSLERKPPASSSQPKKSIFDIDDEPVKPLSEGSNGLLNIMLDPTVPLHSIIKPTEPKKESPHKKVPRTASLFSPPSSRNRSCSQSSNEEVSVKLPKVEETPGYEKLREGITSIQIPKEEVLPSDDSPAAGGDLGRKKHKKDKKSKKDKKEKKDRERSRDKSHKHKHKDKDRARHSEDSEQKPPGIKLKIKPILPQQTGGNSSADSSPLLPKVDPLKISLKTESSKKRHRDPSRSSSLTSPSLKIARVIGGPEGGGLFSSSASPVKKA